MVKHGFTLLVLALALVVFAGCGADRQLQYLVGEWERIDGSSPTLMVKPDGEMYIVRFEGQEYRTVLFRDGEDYFNLKPPGWRIGETAPFSFSYDADTSLLSAGVIDGQGERGGTYKKVK